MMPSSEVYLLLICIGITIHSLLTRHTILVIVHIILLSLIIMLLSYLIILKKNLTNYRFINLLDVGIFFLNLVKFRCTK